MNMLVKIESKEQFEEVLKNEELKNKRIGLMLKSQIKKFLKE